MTAGLILKRAPIRLEPRRLRRARNGVVVGRIFFLDAVGPQGRPWMWASGPAYGYETTREAAMAAIAKSWGRQ